METLATWIVVTRTEMNVSVLPWTLNLKDAGLIVGSLSLAVLCSRALPTLAGMAASTGTHFFSALCCLLSTFPLCPACSQNSTSCLVLQFPHA